MEGRCGTCKWAVPNLPNGRFTLICNREGDYGELADECLFTIDHDCLQVTPTFGCVQWEAK
jgi:hypothetical protein